MDLQDVGWGDMDWIDLDRDRDRWRAVVNALMNNFYKIRVILLVEDLLVSQEGLCFMT
jgi:hypothetical protein